MTRHLPLYGLLLLLWPLECRAQPSVSGQRILFTRHLPQAVRARVPRGAKSCFAGIFRLGPSKPLMFVHLWNGKPEKDLNRDKRDGQYHFTVDVFQMGARKHTGSARLIQRFPLNYKGQTWAPRQFGAQLLWLDPRQKSRPIIKFDCFGEGIYGPSGDNVLAIFSKGSSKKPIIQSFTFGSWRASTTSGEVNTFNDVDSRGLLQISAQIRLATDEIPQPPPVILRWNGRRFKPISGPAELLGQ